jgi:hypothetical protein
MLLGSLSPLLQAAVASRDTIVALTMPAERTAFDMASGTLQILVLLAGLIALVAMAATALALRHAITRLQDTVDRLVGDAKPLLHQATRASEDARDVIKLVRHEAEKIAGATGAVADRLLDVSQAAEERLDQVNALLDVLKDEVQDTAISAAASVRGMRVGAVALGAALSGGRRLRRRRDEADEAPLLDGDEDGDEGDDVADAAEGHGDDIDEVLHVDGMDGDDAALDPAERPYFTADEGDVGADDWEDDRDEVRPERPRRAGRRRRSR